MYTGFIDTIRITRGLKVTWADGRCCIYRCTLPWSIEVATTHKLGEWGDWVKVPFLFIPKKSYNGKWIWGRDIYMCIHPKGHDFIQSTIYAEVMYDTKKNIFMRKLQGGA